MSVTDKITVNAHYTRSVNLERDANSASVINAYIPTSRALKTLSRIADTFTVDQAPRAWSLVGPYGSGKSSFAVFLSHLLAAHEQEATKSALSVLRKADGSLARRFQNIGKASAGHCCALLTGSPEPLSKRLASALADAAATYWSNRSGRSPAVINELRAQASKQQVAVSELMDSIRKLQNAVARSGGNGVLIVIDELGKFLEYEARHYGANDIYVLQAIAEHAYAGHAANVTLVVLLHQSVEQYAKGLGEHLKNEWAKVQGRFENVPFLESTEQVLRVVAAAFRHDFAQADQAKVWKVAAEAARLFARARALPGALDEEIAAELFMRCYPIHPMTALLLPVLCQKLAQNERTLFSYLGSQEPHGFRDSVAALKTTSDWIYPWEIYEYFILNQPATVSDHFTHRRWAEVLTAVDRLGDAPDTEVQLLKTIGLLNIVGAQGDFKASKDIVRLSLPNKKNTDAAVQALLKKSTIQFRKFNGEYRVWQGSDFDLNAAVEEQLSKLGRFDIADAVNRRHAMLPVVARKYSIQNGALRYFLPTFTDAKSCLALEANSDVPRIIFFLTEGQDDRALFDGKLKNHFSELDIAVEYLNTAQLREAVAEVLALEGVRRDSQELNSDPVAQREFKDRYMAALATEQELLAGLIENPGTSVWYWKGKTLRVTTKRSLQEELSRVLEQVYYASPIIKNELINRDKPSSQANAARNKLLMAMLHRAGSPDLGIEKFPAEKGIYRALIQAPGLHRQVNREWRLAGPDPKRDHYNFGPVWKRVESFFEQTEKDPLSFASLDKELMAPPYGVKAGVLPILYIAAYHVNQHELALYEDGVYAPYLTEEHIERFTRRPETFAVQRFRLQGMRASIFEQYSKALYGDAAKKQTLLSIARPLAQFLGSLPEYTQKTKRISSIAQRVRDAFSFAKSPQKLLFELLPQACGLPAINPKSKDQAALEGFAETLTEVLRELKHAYPNFLDRQRQLFCQAFNFNPKTELTRLRSILAGRLAGLEKYTVDIEGLRGFIIRATKTHIDDESWLTTLLMFLGKGQSPKKWLDTDSDAAEFRLSEYARRINDLEKLRVYYEGEKTKRGKNFEVLLLRAVRQGASETDELVSIDNKVRAAIAANKHDIRERLERLGDKELQLALLADLVDEFLVNYRAASDTESRTARTKSHRKEGANDN